jgi:mono/diheme cytochrome c family protein
MVLRVAAMRTIIASLLIAGLMILLGASAVIYSGFYDVAATSPHWPATAWLLEAARTRSIKTHAAGVAVPPGLDDPAKVLIGVGHFAAHCAVCHGAPGVPKGDIAQGLYPPPPDLAKTASLYTPAELFWIVKHGIKMTGMPARSDHSDEELWATVAFLEKLPGMSERDYATLVMASIAQGGHHHTDADDRNPAQPNSQNTPSR